MAGGDIYQLERVQTIPRPLADAFRFFADAFNLEAITPPFLRFRIVTPHHTHAFEPVGTMTRMCDRVRYALPLGPLGRLTHALVVRRTLEAIFDHRRDRISELFA